MRIVRRLKCTLGFLTILPVNGNCSLGETAKGSWLFPLVGAVMGVIAGLAGYLFSFFLPESIAAALAFFVLLVLTGFHHLDGLLDFGDAVMVRGGQGKRQRVMHSPGIGAGAFGVGILTVLITYLALSQSQNIITALVVAEASAKVSMLLVAFLAPPAWPGMGEEFIKALGKNRSPLLLGFILYLLILVPLAGFRSIVLLLAVFVFSIFMARYSKTLIGGVSGDILGAVNEITRMLALVVML